MTREEMNEATTRFLNNGGKVTKLPDGPAFRWYPYSAMSERKRLKDVSELKVDVTVTEDPANAKQESAAGYLNPNTSS